MSNTLFEKWILIQENWFNMVLPNLFENILNKFGDDENNIDEEEVTRKKRRVSRLKKTQAFKQNDL